MTDLGVIALSTCNPQIRNEYPIQSCKCHPQFLLSTIFEKLLKDISQMSSCKRGFKVSHFDITFHVVTTHCSYEKAKGRAVNNEDMSEVVGSEMVKIFQTTS